MKATDLQLIVIKQVTILQESYKAGEQRWSTNHIGGYREIKQDFSKKLYRLRKALQMCVSKHTDT